MSLLLAQSGHSETEFQCPLLGVERTFLQLASMSVIDPKRTLLLRRMQLFWHVPLHRICACGVGDAPRGIRGQARTHACFQQFDIIRTHRSDCGLGTRCRYANCPKILETSECSFHWNLPRFD